MASGGAVYHDVQPPRQAFMLPPSKHHTEHDRKRSRVTREIARRLGDEARCRQHGGVGTASAREGEGTVEGSHVGGFFMPHAGTVRVRRCAAGCCGSEAVAAMGVWSCRHESNMRHHGAETQTAIEVRQHPTAPPARQNVQVPERCVLPTSPALPTCHHGPVRRLYGKVAGGRRQPSPEACCAHQAYVGMVRVAASVRLPAESASGGAFWHANVVTGRGALQSNRWPLKFLMDPHAIVRPPVLPQNVHHARQSQCPSYHEVMPCSPGPEDVVAG